MTATSGASAFGATAAATAGDASAALSIQALRSAAVRDPKAAIKETAKQFEALFMQQLMKSMREATMSSGMLDNSGTRLGTEMLDSQYAAKMTGLPGGLAAAIARQLERQLGSGAAAALAAPAAAGAAAGVVRRALVAAPARVRAQPPGRGARGRGDERDPGGVHGRAGGARIGLGPARDQECRRHVVAQPVRDQGRRRLERTGRRDHDDRMDRG